MANIVFYFDEYTRIDSLGIKIHPYYDPQNKSWYDDYYKLSLAKLGKLYNLDSEELVILGLTYG